MVKYVLLLLFAGTAISHAVTLCDFTPQGTTAGGDTPNPSAVINRDRAPEQRATYENGGLQLRWNTDLQSSFLVGEPWANTVPLKQFKQANCYIELEIPERSPLSCICVKFIDSKQEIFQWGIVVDSREPGSCRLSIPMTPHNFQLAYRGNNDKKIDFPIRFYSFSATARKNSGEASILIKKIEYESTSPDSMWNLISFDLETGNTAHVLRKGEESKLKLLLHNSGSTRCPAGRPLNFGTSFTTPLRKRPSSPFRRTEHCNIRRKHACRAWDIGPYISVWRRWMVQVSQNKHEASPTWFRQDRENCTKKGFFSESAFRAGMMRKSSPGKRRPQLSAGRQHSD